MQRVLSSLTLLTTLALLACGENSALEDGPNANREPAAFFDECVEGCLGDRGLTEEECERACEDYDSGDCAAEAEAAYVDCIDEGGSEDECSDRAGEMYDACTGDRTETGTDPCDAVAEQAWQDCIDAGGTDEDCREAAGVAYDACASGTSTTR